MRLSDAGAYRRGTLLNNNSTTNPGDGSINLSLGVGTYDFIIRGNSDGSTDPASWNLNLYFCGHSAAPDISAAALANSAGGPIGSEHEMRR